MKSGRAKALGIPEGNFGSLALAVTSRIQNPCRRQTMPHPKRIEPVENLSEQASSQSTQRKILRLKSSDARIEKREPLPVQRSEEHTSELQSRLHLVCRLLLEKTK